MTAFWCGVVSREHIKRGESEGFCQACYGKRSPLDRMALGDGIVFYSPTIAFRGTEKCQAFTAIGEVVGPQSYQFQMTPDFVPFRRDITYFDATDAPIRPMLDELEFTCGNMN
ncbi:MAG: EVE domain-containing protein [Hyphomicrobiales bacterium]